MELTGSPEGSKQQDSAAQLALPKLEERRAAPELSEVKIPLFTWRKHNENAAGDWGHRLRNTQECYLLTEMGHFSASNLQLRRHAGLLVGLCA